MEKIPLTYYDALSNAKNQAERQGISYHVIHRLNLKGEHVFYVQQGGLGTIHTGVAIARPDGTTSEFTHKIPLG